MNHKFCSLSAKSLDEIQTILDFLNSQPVEIQRALYDFELECIHGGHIFYNDALAEFAYYPDTSFDEEFTGDWTGMARQWREADGQDK